MDLLTKDQQRMLKRAFETMDSEKKGTISTFDVGQILDLMGEHQNDNTLAELIAGVDKTGDGRVTLDQFCSIGAKFFEDDGEDLAKIQAELKEAFRLYDTEANGYITTEVFREILQELDSNLTEEELDQMIEEIDADGSGTVDFDEFMGVMTG